MRCCGENCFGWTSLKRPAAGALITRAPVMMITLWLWPWPVMRLDQDVANLPPPMFAFHPGEPPEKWLVIDPVAHLRRQYTAPHPLHTRYLPKEDDPMKDLALPVHHDALDFARSYRVRPPQRLGGNARIDVPGRLLFDRLFDVTERYMLLEPAAVVPHIPQCHFASKRGPMRAFVVPTLS